MLTRSIDFYETIYGFNNIKSSKKENVISTRFFHVSCELYTYYIYNRWHQETKQLVWRLQWKVKAIDYYKRFD